MWSFGILIIELVQGEPPYYDQLPVQAMLQIMSKQRPPVKNLDKFSKQLQTVLDMCLEQEPENRASCSELVVHSFFKKACNLEFIKHYIKAIRQA